MMRSMSLLPSLGLGRRQHGSREFIASVDHDTPFGLGFVPTKADYRYMALLRKERLIARWLHKPFNYPIRPYRMSLVDYFETDEYGTSVEIADMIDGVIPRDEYNDEMLMVDMNQPMELRVGLDLSTDERDSLAQLLRSYLDVFAWSYEDMSGLDPSIV
ncbi:hypothetical protein CK203_046127 [Vitis vinifera]|uniref:Uncharacterized protein n=1 Tax=Vitis vinifera TaxID=29760 RepID=A0A438HP29_VITVI|nr:hypothetical protein CK203_046127 [Vitis vinifera]